MLVSGWLLVLGGGAGILLLSELGKDSPEKLTSNYIISPSAGRLCVHAKSLQLCLTLCDPMDCSPPGSSVYGILQARILE